MSSRLLASVETRPIDFAAAAGVNYAADATSSSSSSVSAVDAERLSLAGVESEATQPPPRRRYGRPRYNDNMHNADGSNKYAFVGGIGVPVPIGNTYKYLNPSYGFQVGIGRNFDKNFAMIAQFDYDHFGFNNKTLQNQINLYNYYCTPTQAAAQQCTNFTQLNGTTHVWSFTINPTYSFYSSEGLGAYVVGGVGFYHKVANFTTPTTGTGYDPYYGYYQYSADQTIDHYTSNAPGFNGGLGMTFKPSRFAGERFFVEARYVYIANTQRFGVSINNTPATLNAYQGNNFYAPNSNRTTYIPIKVGIRF